MRQATTSVVLQTPATKMGLQPLSNPESNDSNSTKVSLSRSKSDIRTRLTLRNSDHPTKTCEKTTSQD